MKSKQLNDFIFQVEKQQLAILGVLKNNNKRFPKINIKEQTEAERERERNYNDYIFHSIKENGGI
jgi:hypothetical protein